MAETTLELFDTSSPVHRSPAVLDALAALANEGEQERGAVFTKPEIVTSILDLAGYQASASLADRRLLEPSFGHGDFLLAALSRLLESFGREGGRARDARHLEPAIRAVEIHEPSFHRTYGAVRSKLVSWGASSRNAEALCNAWLVRDDFLLAQLPGLFDFVLGNPPYVRQERIPEALLGEYRRRYDTIYDRADLYIPFYERGLGLLSEGGILAYICANRWIKNRYGARLRDLIASRYHLKYYIDLEGADAFHSEVYAYPAITVIARGSGTVTRVAIRPKLDPASLQSMVKDMSSQESDSAAGERGVQTVAGAVIPRRPWILHSAKHSSLIQDLERRHPVIEEAGCRVGIGVATGADAIFVGNYESLPIEEKRKMRLAMAKDVRNGSVQWGGKGLANPFEEDGSLADLGAWPQFAAYLESHREKLTSRHCAQRSARGWYRTIDRVWSELLHTPKLLIPDIKGGAEIAFDEGEYYPHHNLYWITSTNWDLRALATILRSSLALFFVATYCTKMAGGYLRFQAQYLRRIRVPRWQELRSTERTALLAAPPSDPTAIDRATFSAYGLSDHEGNEIARMASEVAARS
jgi:hypothetical protein